MVFLSIFDELNEVAKFWMINLYLDVSNVIHANEHTKYTNCDLPRNFRILLFVSLCFYNEK